MLRVGTAGWSYPDWEGIVYPKGATASGEALAALARLFDTLEINATFYRPPSPKAARAWVRRVVDRPGFRFTAKMWRGFTHAREERHEVEERRYREGIAPLAEAGLLGAILLQFPFSFHSTTPNRDYLESLLDRFQDLPLVVEVRHDSWLQGSTVERLGRRGVGLCNVDQPLIGRASPPTSLMAGEPGYVRLHGRNREDWFREDAGRDARYDYLYSHEEIREWADRIRGLQRKAGDGADIFIIANNHYRGQAPANALELKHLLTGRAVDVPASLKRAFPRLREIASARPSPGEQGTLPL